MACSAYRSTVHSYAAPLWLLPLCLSDMGQSQGNVPEKQPTSGSYHRSFIKRHLHNGKEPKREAKGRDDLTKIALPSVRYAPEWQQLLKARLELCIPLTAPCPATSQVRRLIYCCLQSSHTSSFSPCYATSIRLCLEGFPAQWAIRTDLSTKNVI